VCVCVFVSHTSMNFSKLSISNAVFEIIREIQIMMERSEHWFLQEL